MKKILFIIGTRPEAIKLSPLIKAFRAEPHYFQAQVCLTGQHQELAKEALDFFGLFPDISLQLKRKENAGLSLLFARLIEQLHPVVDQARPGLVIVQGDTSSALAGALCGYYAQIKVAHVEAGLRTFEPYNPFPEEMNRKMITCLADFHFAPTEDARQNLLKENIPSARIMVTGNTGVDALRLGLDYLGKGAEPEIVRKLRPQLIAGRRLILATLHRRENQGEITAGVCRAIRTIVKDQKVQVLFSIHPNPKVRETVEAELSNHPGIILAPPLSYPAFLWAMQQSTLILTDSGGIQEEAPGIGKQVILVREQTERPEAVKSRHVRVAGIHPGNILEALEDMLAQKPEISWSPNPFGDGHASERILAYLKEHL